MHPGFVSLKDMFPALMLDIRYATPHNLTGEPLDGYLSPKALSTLEAAQALGVALRALEKHGYGLCIFDAYRPQKAVNHFLRWSQASEDGQTKAEFYPGLDKRELFPLGYIALRSGHSRGSTIDLTLTENGVPWIWAPASTSWAKPPTMAIPPCPRMCCKGVACCAPSWRAWPIP